MSKAGNTSPYLPRRPYPAKAIIKNCDSRNKHGYLDPSTSGICYQLEQISASFSTTTGVSGFRYKLDIFNPGIAGGQDGQNKGQLPSIAAETSRLGSSMITGNMAVDSVGAGSVASTIAFSSIANAQIKSVAKREPALWLNDRTDRVLSGAEVVYSLSKNWNGKSMVRSCPDIVITADSSKTGWGAVCNQVTTQGQWSVEERENHINALELTAAFFALQAFTKGRTEIHVLMRVDNRATQAQINKMGGPRSKDLLKITQEVWQY